MKQFDIVIAGGAMAGMTLALTISKLSESSLSIAVVEPYQADYDAHPGFDSRAIALSLGTVNILKQYDLWQGMSEFATPIKRIHVSDRGHAGMTDIDHQEISVDALGYVVELTDVGRYYNDKVSQHDNIHLLCPAHVSQIERLQHETRVTLNDGQLLAAKLLVAADGAASTCCEQLGVESELHDFEQVAIIANVKLAQAHQGRAYERFTSTGPLALLPMSEQRMSLVWCLEPDHAAQIMSLDDSEFKRALQAGFGWRMGEFQTIGHRSSYPLQQSFRQQNTSHRTVIIGNAAQTLHPIAGQGFNLGIRDIATLAESIMSYIQDPGAYSVLSEYKRRREIDRAVTVSLTSSLVHIFSNDYLSFRLARNLGLAAMDNVTMLKAPLLTRTLGLVAR